MTAFRMPRRAAVVLLLLALPLTLAPRTSWPLNGGWRAVTHSDTFESGRGAVRSLVFAAIPPPDSVQTFLTVTITGGDWTLVRASDVCSAVAGKVVCVLDPSSMRRTHVLRITVRTDVGDSLQWTMSTAAGA